MTTNPVIGKRRSDLSTTKLYVENLSALRGHFFELNADRLVGDISQSTASTLTVDKLTVNQETVTDIVTDTIAVSGVLEMLPGSVIDGVVIPTLPPNLVSIGGLSTSANQMLYTVSGSTFATTGITSFGRSLIDTTNAADAQNELGLVIGTDVQAQSSILNSISSNGINANEIQYGISPNVMSTTVLTPFARTLLDDADASTARVTLGIPSGNLLSDTNTETITNKTATDTSNTIHAKGLIQGDLSTVTIDGSAPAASGYLLISTGSGTAEWQQDPATSTTGSVLDNQIVRYNGTTGKSVQGSSATIDDSGNISTSGSVTGATLAGTLTTAAQPNITSVGSLSALTVNGNITVTGNVDGSNISALQNDVDGFNDQLKNFTTSQILQLLNIDTTTVSVSQWSILGALNQNLATTDTPTFTGLSANSQKITSVATPTDSADAANKSYVDSVASGVQVLESSRVATTGNLNATYVGTPTFTLTNNGTLAAIEIDGISLSTNDRVLVKNQSTATQNGIYIVSTVGSGATEWVLTRSSDFDSSAEISNGQSTFISEGSSNGFSTWVLTTENPITLDTSDLTFALFGKSSTIVAGDGLTLTGSTLDVGGTAGRISVSGTAVNIDTSYIGQNTITTLGTITTGAWEATDVGITHGGTGASTASNARTNLGLEIGTDVQAFSEGLVDLDAVGIVAANQYLYGTGLGTYAYGTISSFGRSLVDDSTASDARTTLGLGNTATQSVTGSVVGTSDAQTLTSKTIASSTLNDSSVSWINNADNTKQLLWDLSGITTSTTRTLVIPNQSGTLTLNTGAQTLDSKTLTNAVITSGTNDVTASRTNALATSGSDVTITSTAPAGSGYILQTTGTTTATWQLPSTVSPARTITVGQSGADYTSIVSALAAASALTPTASDPVSIVCYPGVYTETNPIICVSYVSITCSAPNDVIFEPVTVGNDMFSLVPNCYFRNIRVQGCTGGAGFIARFTGPSQFCTIERTTVSNCLVGFDTEAFSGTTANTSIVQCIGCTVLGSGLASSIGFRAGQGGTIGIRQFGNATAFTGVLDTGYLSTGTNSSITGASMDSTFCNFGIVASSGASVRIISGLIQSSVNTGVQINADSRVEAFGVQIIGTLGALDITTTASSSTLIASGTEWNQGKVSYATGSNILASSISEFAGDEAQNIVGELSVGSIERPSESIFGEGDSTIEGMICLTFDPLGSFVDVTSDLTTRDDGNTVALFSNTITNSAFYIGSTTPYTFPGIRITLTGALVLGAGSIVHEYWDGSAWSSFNTMITNANAPYRSFGQDLEVSTGNYQIRFSQLTGSSAPGGSSYFTSTSPGGNPWATTTVDGTSAYWVRLRVVVPITTSPVADQVKLHTNRVEINGDGFVEFFGSSRAVKIIYPAGIWNHTSMTPSNNDVYISNTLRFDGTDNEFQNNATDTFTMTFSLPEDTCTSCPLVLRWRYTVSTTNGGNIAWIVRYGYSRNFADDSSSISSVYNSSTGTSPNEVLVTATTSGGFNADKQYNGKVLISIPDALAYNSTTGDSDIIWVLLERQGSAGADTYTGSAYGITHEILYRSWSLGNYVE